MSNENEKSQYLGEILKIVKQNLFKNSIETVLSFSLKTLAFKYLND